MGFALYLIFLFFTVLFSVLVIALVYVGHYLIDKVFTWYLTRDIKETDNE